MAPESFRGFAQPASDLYSVGATLLFALTGRPPSSFPMDRMQIDLTSLDGVVPTYILDVVEGLLEPVAEDRLTADEALDLLRLGSTKNKHSGVGSQGGDTDTLWQGDSSPKVSPSLQKWGKTQGVGKIERFRTAMMRDTRKKRTSEKSLYYDDQSRAPLPTGLGKSQKRRRKPSGTRIQVTKTPTHLEIDIPPAGLRGLDPYTGVFAIAWNAFVAFWTAGALAGGGILFALFSLPFWFAGATIAKQALGRSLIRERINVTKTSWTLQQKVGVFLEGSTAESPGERRVVSWDKGVTREEHGRTKDLFGARVEIVGYVNGAPQTHCVLKQGVQDFVFGEALDPVEQEWMVSLLNQFLQEKQDDSIDTDMGDDVPHRKLLLESDYDTAWLQGKEEEDDVPHRKLLLESDYDTAWLQGKEEEDWNRKVAERDEKEAPGDASP